MIVVVDTEPLVDDAGADDMAHQQERDQKAEPDLGGLPGGHAQTAASPELVNDQSDVGEQRAVEQHRAGQAAPDRDEDHPTGLHGGERVDAERMIDQMARREQHQDQAGGQAQPGGQIRARTHLGHSTYDARGGRPPSAAVIDRGKRATRRGC